MNYFQQKNLDYYLVWFVKFKRGYTELDPWPRRVRRRFNLSLARKRRAARAWLVNQCTGWVDISAVPMNELGYSDHPPKSMRHLRSVK